MERSRGTSVLVLGIVLGVVGAIMYWAVTADTEGFNINTAGLILFWLGPAERSSAPWFVPSVPLATALLGTAVLWLSRHRQGTSGRGDLRRGARIGQRGDRTGP